MKINDKYDDYQNILFKRSRKKYIQIKTILSLSINMDKLKKDIIKNMKMMLFTHFHSLLKRNYFR